jgi:acyl-CoA thioesterase
MASPLVPLDTLLGGASAADGRWHYSITPDWMQGRTAYGGISAAVALDAALRDHPGDAPLRTAQIGFVGPVATQLVRHSKSSRFVQADVSSGSGFGTSALFTFSLPRTSHVDHEITPMPAIAAPLDLVSVPEHAMRPAFTNHFDMKPAGGPGFGHAKESAEILTWVRWIAPPTCPAQVALLAMADALPPAALTLFTQFGPLSSSSWICHFLTDVPASDDGWWLLSSRSTHVRRGFSTQDMAIWNSAGELVMTGNQGVAIYV